MASTDKKGTATPKPAPRPAPDKGGKATPAPVPSGGGATPTFGDGLPRDGQGNVIPAYDAGTSQQLAGADYSYGSGLAGLGADSAAFQLDWQGTADVPTYKTNPDGSYQLDASGSPIVDKVAQIKNPYSKQAQLSKAIADAQKGNYYSEAESGHSFDGAAGQHRANLDFRQGAQVSAFQRDYQAGLASLAARGQSLRSAHELNRGSIEAAFAQKPAAPMGTASPMVAQKGYAPGQGYYDNGLKKFVIVNADGTVRPMSSADKMGQAKPA